MVICHALDHPMFEQAKFPEPRLFSVHFKQTLEKQNSVRSLTYPKTCSVIFRIQQKITVLR